MEKRFVITGGAGFIGSAVVRQLLRRTPHHVLVVDKLTYAGSSDTIQAVRNDPRFKFWRADICDFTVVQEVFHTFRPDVVLHLAAETHVDRSIDGPGAFVQTNIHGTFVLLQAALRYWNGLKGDAHDAFRFHHVSTDEVFGSLGATGVFTEESPYRPNSPYAATKAASDHLVRAWHHTYGLPVIVSNCSNNYGPFQFPEKLMPMVILNALGGRAIPVYGRGANVRDWLYVDDHADALVQIAEKGRVGYGYNVGANCERTNLDVVRQICQTLDQLLPDQSCGPRERLIEFVPDRPGHDFRYATDTSRMRNELGWAPVESFESGVRKTVSWYLDNREWWDRIWRQTYQGQRLGLGRVVPPRDTVACAGAGNSRGVFWPGHES